MRRYVELKNGTFGRFAIKSGEMLFERTGLSQKPEAIAKIELAKMPPIGLILCASKDHEDVELVRLSGRGIQISEYITQLPPRHLFEKKLHEAVRLARKRFPGKPDLPTNRPQAAAKLTDNNSSQLNERS